MTLSEESDKIRKWYAKASTKARAFIDKLGVTIGIMVFASLTNFGKDPGNDLGVRLSGPAGGVTAIIAALLFTLLWGQTSLDDQISLGVIVTADASLKDGPHVDARGVPVAEGMELRVLDARDAWSEVELAGGRRGWISQTSIEAF